MTSLREHHRITGRNEQCIKVGDVVLVHDNIPRARWKMAIVEQLIRGRDGYAGAANIRYSEGKTNRPIAKLYPLELSSTNSNEEQHATTNKATSDNACQSSTNKATSDDACQSSTNKAAGDDVCQSSTNSITSTRPTRNSATMAQQKIANWTRMLLSSAPEDVED